MDEMVKLLSLLADMESFSPHDKLSKIVSDAADRDSGELSEWDLDLVSAAGAQAYQKFLRKLDEQDMH